MNLPDPFVPSTRPQRGACPVCGYEGLLTRGGKVAPHFEMRVKRGADGLPVQHPGRLRCAGKGADPEPLEPVDPEVAA